MILDQRPVWQAGQVVEMGAFRQFGLDLLALGEVDRRRKQEIAVENPRRPAGFQEYALAVGAADTVFGHDRVGL